ncbi:hypothetical protein Tco_0929557 [Tanacetum coccineum]
MGSYRGARLGRNAPPNPLQSPLGILSSCFYERNAPSNTRNMEMESDIENMTMSEYLKDIFDMWDITIEDVERVRQFLTPNVPDVIDNIQPLILITIHTTPPDEDYVAPATKSILDDILEEFGDEILNVTMVDKGVECSPSKDLEEL